MVCERHGHIVLRAMVTLRATRQKHRVLVQQRLEAHKEATALMLVKFFFVQCIPVRAANLQDDIFGAPRHAQRAAVGRQHGDVRRRKQLAIAIREAHSWMMRSLPAGEA